MTIEELKYDVSYPPNYERYYFVSSDTYTFSYISAFYNSGSSNPIVGGGILGGIVAIPLVLGFNKYVAYAVLFGIAGVFITIISGITFSSIIIAARELIVDLFASTKEEYDQNLQEIKASRENKKVKKKNSKKFMEIAEQSDVIDYAEQLNFELDDEEDEPEEEDSEEDKELTKKNLRKLINRRCVAGDSDEQEEQSLELEHNTIEEDEEGNVAYVLQGDDALPDAFQRRAYLIIERELMQQEMQQDENGNQTESYHHIASP